jgi:glycosyltransferase involved in cell wall biosynthesis
VAAGPGEPGPGREIRGAVRERLKFLFVSARFWPDLGGAERQLGLLASFLVRQGHGVTVICQKRAVADTPGELNGVEVVRLSPGPGGRLRSLAFAVNMVRFLSRRGKTFDVVHANLASSPALVARLWAWRRKRPAVLKFGASGSLGDAAVSRGTALGRWKLRRLQEGFDLYLCPNGEIRREFLDLGFPAAKLAVFPNGVDAGFFRPADGGEREDLRRKLGWEGRVVALFTGRFEPQKNLLPLLEGWKPIVARHRGALLILVGEGSQGPLLRGAAGVDGPGGAVRVLGRQESHGLRGMLQAADFFVLPSLMEGMSNSLLEAMACGLPALVSDIPGSRDMITNGQNGFLFSLDDPAGLSGGLERLLASSPERRKLGAEARRTIERAFTLEKVGARYLDYMGVVLGASSSRRNG